MPDPSLTLGVAVIARDARAMLPGCLAGVLGWADDVLVADTGSVDGTPAVARREGARVAAIGWDDSFAAARNDATAQLGTEWVLSLDTDETVLADPAGLRSWLQGLAPGTDAVAVLIDTDGGPDVTGLARHRELKLFRRHRLAWTGRVHERLRLADGGEPRWSPIPPELLRLRHFGYRDASIVYDKAARNARLSLIELRECTASGAPAGERARVLLDLGRSYLGCARVDAAREAFAGVRELCHDGPSWLWATEQLARLSLADNDGERALEFAHELEAAAAPRSAVTWLRAQVLARRGDFDHARLLATSITDFRDVGGNELDHGPITALMRLLDGAAGPVLSAGG